MSAPEDSIQSILQPLQAEIEAALRESMEGLPADCPALLRESMSYSLLAGGKRLRPILVLLACEACGGNRADAMPAATAIEMIHTYSLIHDDLPAMDDDDLRRGRPTNHIVFGEGQAVLAGDGLLTLAFEVIARDIRPAEIALECSRELASAAGACGMVGGQVADLQAENAGVQNVNELEAIHRRKTGRLLSAALVMGGLIGRADAETLDLLRKYGTAVGLAFQIADDLLDVTGTSEKMGKSVQKDSGHGKLTYPSLIGAESSRAKALDLVAAARQAVMPFGPRGHRLDALARFVVERDH